MSNMFEFESVEFTTQSLMNKEKSRLVDELCEFAGVDRNQFRLQQGNITLYGVADNGAWLPITSYISEFGQRVKAKSFKSFKLKTKLQITQK